MSLETSYVLLVKLGLLFRLSAADQGAAPFFISWFGIPISNVVFSDPPSNSIAVAWSGGAIVVGLASLKHAGVGDFSEYLGQICFSSQ